MQEHKGEGSNIKIDNVNGDVYFDNNDKENNKYKKHISKEIMRDIVTCDNFYKKKLTKYRKRAIIFHVTIFIVIIFILPESIECYPYVQDIIIFFFIFGFFLLPKIIVSIKSKYCENILDSIKKNSSLGLSELKYIVNLSLDYTPENKYEFNHLIRNLKSYISSVEK